MLELILLHSRFIPEWLWSLILVITGALIALGSTYLMYQVRKADEKKKLRLSICDEIIDSTYILKASIFNLLNNHVEFMFHNVCYLLEEKQLDFDFSKIYHSLYNELEFHFFENQKILYRAIRNYNLILEENKIINECRKEIKEMRIIHPETYRYRTLKFGEIVALHEDVRRNLRDLVEKEFYTPFDKLSEEVEKIQKKIKK